MRHLKNGMLAAILICGMTMVLTSCSSKDDDPAPSQTLPKSYNLVADEYKEAILDSTIWTNIANTPQDQGQTFTIESPKPGARLNIVIMGESAGGGLTARMALWNKDKGNVPVKGAVLIYPMLDYRTGGPADLYKDDMTGEFVWTKEDNVLGWAYLKHEQDIPADEMIYYSPAVATPEQLKGFPTTFLIVGTLDLFVHEDKAFVEQLKLAGVQAESHVETGVPHSYDVMLNDSPQTIRFKNLRDNHVKAMFESGSN